MADTRQNRFGVIGGDKRQDYLAQSLARDGQYVYAYGLDPQGNKGVVAVSLDELCQLCNILVFPLPITTDGLTLHAPRAEQVIPLDDAFAQKLQGKRVFGGLLHRLPDREPWKGLHLLDYSVREEFAVQNAVPTAEGAIEIAMRESPDTLNGSRCLITGYGRIGKVLSHMLAGLGACVTVSARKPEDLSWIALAGYGCLHTQSLSEDTAFDFIFNTIPALIFDRKRLAKLPKNCLLIDLASAPGGIDFAAAENLGMTAIQALSLPGKVAPKKAGEIMKNTIYNMIEE